MPVTLEPPPAPDPGEPETRSDPGKPISVRDSAGAAVAELATLRERVAGWERLGAELATERDAWRDQAARHEEAAQQLRTLVAQAQQLTRALPAGDDGAPPDQPPRPGPWQRLRRRLRGE